jgi:hypothetical protein
MKGTVVLIVGGEQRHHQHKNIYTTLDPIHVRVFTTMEGFVAGATFTSLFFLTVDHAIALSNVAPIWTLFVRAKSRLRIHLDGCISI